MVVKSKEELISYINGLKRDNSLYIIEFDGERLTMNSDKQAWSTIGAAKNALRYGLSGTYYQEHLKFLKELETEGRLIYKKI